MKDNKLQTQLTVENLGGSAKKSIKKPKDETEKKLQEFAKK